VFMPNAEIVPDITPKTMTLSAVQSNVESVLLSTPSSSMLEPSSQISLRAGSFSPTLATSPARRCQLLTLLPLLENSSNSSSNSVVLLSSAVDAFVSLDPVSVQSISLLPPPGPSSSTDSIYSIFASNTSSHYGKGTLKEWCHNPSTDLKVIGARHDVVAFFFENAAMRDRLHSNLRGLPNLAPITRKVKSGKGNLKELYNVYTYANILPQVIQTLEDNEGDVEGSDSIKSYIEQIRAISDQLGNLRVSPFQYLREKRAIR